MPRLVANGEQVIVSLYTANKLFDHSTHCRLSNLQCSPDTLPCPNLLQLLKFHPPVPLCSSSVPPLFSLCSSSPFKIKLYDTGMDGCTTLIQTSTGSLPCLECFLRPTKLTVHTSRTSNAFPTHPSMCCHTSAWTPSILTSMQWWVCEHVNICVYIISST